MGDGPDCTFHGHEVVGARLAVKMLDRLHFPKELIERVGHLIRYHMFYYNVGEVSEAGVRRFLRRIGLEYLDDLLKVREADRIGSNVPKAFPYKLRHLLFMIDKVKRDPIHPKMLALDGNELMELLKLKPSRKVGDILSVLLEEVLDDPARNTKEWLTEKAKELSQLSDQELGNLSDKAKETKDEAEEEVESDIKAKYHIK
jgi:poly(A) polymerase/tRNA nucleotidyltransferase (CCA-adding enzyme)